MNRARILLLLLPISALSNPRPTAWGADQRQDYPTREHPAVTAPAASDRIELPAQAANLLTNGDFESGLAGWTVDSDKASGVTAADWESWSGTSAPFSGNPIPPPSHGELAAISDETGPSSLLLLQNVQIPNEGATLSCALFIENYHGGYANPNSLDWSVDPNQQIRVDILAANAPNDALGSGVLRNLFITSPGDPLFQAAGSPAASYFTLLADLSDFAGQRIRLRFANVNNQDFLILGVDNCSITPKSEKGPEIGAEIPIVPANVRPENPHTVYGPDGRKAVIWQQLGTGGTIICIQVFDAQGNLITNPKIINSTQGINRNPSGDFDPSGTLTVFWTRDSGTAVVTPDGKITMLASAGSSVLGRKFDPNQGGGTTTSSEVNIGPGEDPESNTSLSGDQAVAWNEDGDVVVQMFDKNGNPKGSKKKANSQSGAATGQTLATDASGNAAVVFQQTAGEQGLFLNLLGQKGSTKLVNITNAKSALYPSVSMDSAGNSVVAWQQVGPDGLDIFAQRFDAKGNKKGNRFRVNSNIVGDQTRPRVDLNSAGDFAIVWESGVTPSPSAASFAGGSVLGRSFDPSGSANEEEDVVLAESNASTEPAEPDVTINDDDDVVVVFQRRTPGSGQSQGIFRKEVNFFPPGQTCTTNATTQCLAAGKRFRVTALFEEGNGDLASAQAKALTADTGYFTFFDPSNVEVVLKVLNGCAFNNRFWVYAAGLTDVETTLRVDDMVTGQSMTYFNQSGSAFQPILDTNAFATCSGTASVRLSDDELEAVKQRMLAELANDLEPLATLPVEADSAAAAACNADADTLCLGGRFAVEVDFSTAQGASGFGQQTAITADTGYFTFFDPGNVEVVIKVLNGCGFNNRYWVYAGGLTDVEARVVVRDTQTGDRQVYRNNLGTPFQPIRDTNAFANCP